MEEIIKEFREFRRQSLNDTWNDFREHFKREGVKKADVISYIDGLEASDTYDNLFFNQGYFQALEDLECKVNRSLTRQGKNEI